MRAAPFPLIYLPSFLAVGALACGTASAPSEPLGGGGVGAGGGMAVTDVVGGAAGGLSAGVAGAGGSAGLGSGPQGGARNDGGTAATTGAGSAGQPQLGGGGGVGAGGATAGAGGDGALPQAGAAGQGGEGSAGVGGAGGTVAATGGAGAAGAGGMGEPGGEACPADASFCADFESAAMPAGAVFKLNGDPATPWTNYFEVDTAVAHAGASSLRVRSDAGGAYRFLAVASGGSAFWFRFYIRSDKELGVADHNDIVLATKTDEPNDMTGVQFSEDVGLCLRSDDSDIHWPEGYGRSTNGQTTSYALAANAWHCVEISFDGANRVQKLYVEGELLIEATDSPKQAVDLQTLKFGYNALHGTQRELWYDDVAVAPNRIGCL